MLRLRPGEPRDCAVLLGVRAPLAREARVGGDVRKTITVVFSRRGRFDGPGRAARSGVASRSDGSLLRGDAVRLGASRGDGGEVHRGRGMAVFGSRVLREDDALRAVRAAAEMRETLARLNEELEREWGVTTPGARGREHGRGRRRRSARTARRSRRVMRSTSPRDLQTAAQPGRSCSATSTYRLVRRRGQGGAGRIARAQGQGRGRFGGSPAGGAGRRPAPARLADRRSRRGALASRPRLRRTRCACRLAIWSRCLDAAGVGKSRLVDEFLRGRADEAMIVRGRCLPYGEGITFCRSGT